jgi:hypothetical protein
VKAEGGAELWLVRAPTAVRPVSTPYFAKVACPEFLPTSTTGEGEEPAGPRDFVPNRARGRSDAQEYRVRPVGARATD